MGRRWGEEVVGGDEGGRGKQWKGRRTHLTFGVTKLVSSSFVLANAVQIDQIGQFLGPRSVFWKIINSLVQGSTAPLQNEPKLIRHPWELQKFGSLQQLPMQKHLFLSTGHWDSWWVGKSLFLKRGFAKLLIKIVIDLPSTHQFILQLVLFFSLLSPILSSF